MPDMQFDWATLIANTPLAAVAFWFARELLLRFDKALDKVDAGFAIIQSNMQLLAGQIMNDLSDKHRETSHTLQRIEEQVSVRGK